MSRNGNLSQRAKAYPTLTRRGAGEKYETARDHEATHNPGEGEAEVVEGVPDEYAGGGVDDAGHRVQEGHSVILSKASRVALEGEGRRRGSVKEVK